MATRFGTYVKTRRLARGMSQYRLAKECGISQTYLRQIEAGIRKPPSDRVVASLGRALGMNTLDMMDLRILSGHNVYCPKCGHGFIPTQESREPVGWEKDLIDGGRQQEQRADLGRPGPGGEE